MTNQRPFRILGLQQVAIGGLEKSKLAHFWGEVLGLAQTGSYQSESENVDEDIFTLGAGAFAVELDLMQPIDAEKKPRVHQPALNHIGLWVDDLASAHGWLQKNGVRFTPGGIRKGAAGHDVCFVHPKGSDDAPQGAEGVLVELVQAPAEVRQAFATITAATTRE